MGRAGTFVISAAFLGLGIWLYLEVMHLKSWARKSFIKKPGTITLKFNEPIEPGLDKEEFMDKFNESINNIIESK